MEDNEATIRIISTGKSQAMRHVGRTHRVDLAFLHEAKENKHIIVNPCPTDYMCADIFTKTFTNKQKWEQVAKLIAHVDPQVFWSNDKNRRAPDLPPPGKLTPLGRSPLGVAPRWAAKGLAMRFRRKEVLKLSDENASQDLL